MVRVDVDWVLLPVPGTAGARFSIFISPRLGIEEGEPAEQTIASYPEWVDWPHTLAGFRFGVQVDDRDPVEARVTSSASTDLWTRMFPPTTRVEPFVHEHPEVSPTATFDAITVLDDVLTGYSEMAAADLVPPDPWDENFWKPEEWGVPEPEEPEMRWVPDDPGFDPDPGAGEGGAVEVVGETPELGEEETALAPAITDFFPKLFVPPETETGPGPNPDEELKLQPEQPNESWAWSATSELEFTTANASKFRLQADVVTRALPVSETFEVEEEWANFAAFNRLGQLRSEEAFSIVGAEPMTTQEQINRHYDFHRMLAALGEHPALLRPLGLLVDVECPPDRLPEGDVSGIRLVLLPDPAVGPEDWVPEVAVAGRTNHLMVTQVARASAGAGGGLVLRSRADGVPPGLAAAATRCRIEQFDFEGVGQMLQQLAGEEARTNQALGSRAPTMRTAGLRLIQRGSAADLTTQSMVNSQAGQQNTGMELYAEDVQRGARIDVLDEKTGRWHSLHDRQVRYAVPGDQELDEELGQKLERVQDEGLMHLTLTTRSVAAGAEVPSDAPVGISDAIASWDGWSLSAPRPGKVVSSDPVVADPAHREETGATMAVRVENDALTSCGVSIAARATPGSLPRLRFGRSYRMRMRTVDLAGAGYGLEQADRACEDPATADAAVTPGVVFRRFEPVPPPDITYAAPAPAPDDGIDRNGETERRLVVRTGLAADEMVFGEEPGVTERVLVPPGCSVTMAEWHGLFDAAIGLNSDAAARRASYDLAATEEGVVTPGVTATPHLADPGSKGVTLWDLPGMAAGEVWGADWPLDPDGHPRPLVLRLEGIDAGAIRMPEADAEGRVLTVFLPAGERAAIKVASRVQDLDLMALPHIWNERLDADAGATAVAKLAQGTHPQVTPATILELVHAVPRPLVEPVPADGEDIEARSRGSTSVRITRRWQVDSLSTGSLGLTARWTRPRDDLFAPTLAQAGDPDAPLFYVPYTEVFTATVGRHTPVPLPASAAASSRAVLVEEAGVGHAAAAIELGHTAHVRISVRAEATSRFTDFFPPLFREPVGDLPDHFTTVSQWREIDVPATEKPPEPVITDVLPLIVRHRDGDVVTREGGWLRVWLARPWFVTGEEEMPAIVAVDDTQPSNHADPRHALASLVAPDPARGQRMHELVPSSIYGEGPVPPVPVSWMNLLSVPPEDANPLVMYLSDREVSYDPDRAAWFTDVRIDLPRLYFPFVRLALVRDQPHSIPRAEGGSELRCSTVVTLDPINVIPDRRLTVTDTGAGVAVRLQGPRGPYSMGAEGTLVEIGVPPVEVSMQRRVADGDELLSWETLFAREIGLNADMTEDFEVLDVSEDFAFDPTNPEGEYRLLVVEKDPSASTMVEGREGELVWRITYAETVPIARAVVRP